ncbi:MAG: membrane dipeptidase [Clostridia bacterium]|nr:membrane dipeptidase [Clostridia bacterium]
MKYFDLHCDTLTKLYDGLLTFDNRETHVNRSEIFSFEEYRQVFAIWSDPALHPNEGFDRFCSIADNINTFKIPLQNSILAVEGADILNGKLERLDKMYAKGVRILTLMWKGRTCIGGSYDTDYPLDRFGGAVLRHCFHLDIVPDLSHASDRTFFDCIPYAEKAGKPLIASHSNSRAVFDHPRNLTDEMFGIIRDLGGVVGISLYPNHVCSGECTVEDVLRHIEHYIMMDGENTVCLGCDFDGIEITPKDIPSARFITNLAYEMEKRGYGNMLINKIFFENADTFFSKNIAPFKPVG